MNGKKAKALRQAAKRMASEMGFGIKRELIETNVHGKLYPWLVKHNVHSDGTKTLVDPGVREVCTLVNHPHSERQAYRFLKSQYRKGVRYANA